MLIVYYQNVIKLCTTVTATDYNNGNSSGASSTFIKNVFFVWFANYKTVWLEKQLLRIKPFSKKRKMSLICLIYHECSMKQQNNIVIT